MRRPHRDPMPVLIPGEWTAQAACSGVDADVMFPVGKGRGRTGADEAKALCARCPVSTECLEFALTFPMHQDYGIWGGTTPRERQSIRTRRRHNLRAVR